MSAVRETWAATTPNPPRVALYARVSTREKDQDPELQLEALRAYVAARGWEAVEYVDLAAAGDLAHRGAWARLLGDAAQRKLDMIMVWKLDRAFRSTLHALSTLRDLEHAGVGFASLTQPELDTTSATGRLVFTILAAVAEMERELIADRVKEGMRHAARQGKQIGRPPVTARPGFASRWSRVQADLAARRISRQGPPVGSGSGRRPSDGSWPLNSTVEADPMAEFVANASDAAICRLLAGGPLPTEAIADRLAMPNRTVRYRLARLRQAGVVVTDPDKLHHLAEPAPDLAVEPLPALAEPAPALAGPAPDLAAEPLPAFADPAPAIAAATDSDQPSPSHSGHWSPGTVLVAAVLGLAAAGVVAVALGTRGTPPPEPSPTPPQPPRSFGNEAGLPGGLG